MQLCAQAGEGNVTEEVVCDAVAMSGGWSPVVHLWSHCGGKLTWDADQAFFRPDPTRPPTDQNGAGFVTCLGAADGALLMQDTVANADAAARAVVAQLGGSTSDLGVAPKVAPVDEAPIAPVWVMPQGGRHRKTQQDVARLPERRESV